MLPLRTQEFERTYGGIPEPLPSTAMLTTAARRSSGSLRGASGAGAGTVERQPPAWLLDSLAQAALAAARQQLQRAPHADGQPSTGATECATLLLGGGPAAVSMGGGAWGTPPQAAAAACGQVAAAKPAPWLMPWQTGDSAAAAAMAAAVRGKRTPIGAFADLRMAKAP